MKKIEGALMVGMISILTVLTVCKGVSMQYSMKEAVHSQVCSIITLKDEMQLKAQKAGVVPEQDIMALVSLLTALGQKELDVIRLALEQYDVRKVA